MKALTRYLTYVFGLVALASCACMPPPVPEPTVPYDGALTIPLLKGEMWREMVGEEVTVVGYYVDDPVPMLVEDPQWLRVNTPIPELRYVRVVGEGATVPDVAEYFGAMVEYKCTLQLESDEESDINTAKFGQSYPIILDCKELPRILEKASTWLKRPVLVDTCATNPHLCRVPTTEVRLRDRKALLISGGINKNSAHKRYWNDLKFMYQTLRSVYKFPKGDIIVVYKDGKAEDKDMPVTYAASTSGMDSAFKDLAKPSSIDMELLFIFTTNHGGGFSMDGGDGLGAPGPFGGRLDTSGDETDEAIFENTLATDLNGDADQSDQVRYDEVTYLYNQTTDLWDDDFAKRLSALDYNTTVVVMGQCFSGGNIADLRGNRRILISASSEYEMSWSQSNLNYDEFTFHFTSALAGANPDGTKVDPDTNGDGNASMVEAFEYARSHDGQNETPWYEDSGDGRAHPGPLPQGGDGTLGATVTLSQP